MSNKAFLPILCIVISFTGCGSILTSIYFNPTGNAPHYSSGTQTRFGTVHVWNIGDYPNNNDIAYILATDVTAGTNVKYLLVAPRLIDGLHLGNTLSNFNITHAISLQDSDARALQSVLQSISNSAPNDSTYFHYSCSAQLNIAPTTVSTNARGFSSVSTSVASETTWVTLCDVTFYLGTGSFTIADGTSWTESFPLDKSGFQRMDSVLQTAIADLENQR
jgi:hypothetical protein